MSLLADRMAAPTHAGPLAAASGSGTVGNPACGDRVTIMVRVGGASIEAARFESVGSAYEQAVASVLCEAVEGRPVAEAAALSPDDLLVRLPDLPRTKHHLAFLSIDGLRLALADAASGGGAGREEDPDSELQTERFLRGLLHDGARLSTTEIRDAGRAEGVPLPDPLVRFLARLRHDGVLDGEIDLSCHGWCWWLPGEAPPRRGDPGDEKP